jgi:hypothetical protein
MSNEVPVERLLSTAEAVLKRKPGSPEAHYTLARIHYLAFSRDAATVPAYSYERDGNVALPSTERIAGSWWDAQWNHAQELARDELGIKTNPERSDERFWAAVRRHFDRLRQENWRPSRLTVDEKAAHAEKSLSEFQAALQLAPDNALYLLGLASLVDEVVQWRRIEKPPNLPRPLQKITAEIAIDGYTRAHEIAFKADGLLVEQPVSGRRSLVSWEAGHGYLRLTEAKAATDSVVKQTRDKINERLKRLDQLPMGAITPVVISPQPVQNLEALLNKEASVEFDLRGYGPRERWPWLQPEAGLLVWDPSGVGRIEGASQLFGGYSFQIFRADGYDALAALDEDGDGMLRGDELRGIRVWFDRDGNGVSATDEVHDLAELGIVGLATRATGQDGVHPMNSAGVIFADGRTLPSWDWIVAPHDNLPDASN